jgi:hypothetical protein
MADWEPIKWKPHEDREESGPVRKLSRRLLGALAASVVFHVIAMVTPAGSVFLEPIVVWVSVNFPGLGPHEWGYSILVGFSVLFYAIVFWTLGTIWCFVRELVPGRARN